MEATFKRTFASFEVRNFRLYFFGQGLSMCGTWMQTVALSWLVLQLTHSGTQLGLIVATQFLPILCFGIFGGLVADRFDKRRILYVTQSLSGLLALGLGLLIVGHIVHVWMVYLFAAALGLVTIIDNPSRQTFVIEMVGSERLRNAVTLNSTIVNAARVIGPSIAGVLIATIGIGECFLLNAVSYLAVLAALFAMDGSALHRASREPPQPRQIRQGLRYAWHTPALRITLIMMFVIGTFAYEFPVILPLFATKTLHGSAATYSAMMAAMGAGAVVGGLYSAGRTIYGAQSVARAALLFGSSIVLTAAMPTMLSIMLVLVIVGGLSVLLISLGNTTLQLSSADNMRGRVMALWAIAFFGTTPIGGPIIGAIADHTNPRLGLLVGGVTALLAAGYGLIAARRS